MSAQPLSTLDRNARSPPTTSDTKPAPAFAAESKQHGSLHARLLSQEKTGKQVGAYVSPSDDILSPASAKLNAVKEKRFLKSTKPRQLFMTSNSERVDEK